MTILMLDSSFFYSQLSGAGLGKVKGGYTASLSYGHARQFSDIPSAGGGWGMNLAMGKNLYYDTDALLAFDLIGNLACGHAFANQLHNCAFSLRKQIVAAQSGFAADLPDQIR